MINSMITCVIVMTHTCLRRTARVETNLRSSFWSGWTLSPIRERTEKGVEMHWSTSQMSPAAPSWNSKHTAELKEEKKWEKPQPIFFWPSGCALHCSLALCSLSPFFIKEKHMSCRGVQVWNSILIPQTVFLLKPLLSRQAGRAWPTQLGAAQLCGYALCKDGRGWER